MSDPALVQVTSSDVEQNNGSHLRVKLPHPTQAGNALVVMAQTGGSAASAVVRDDAGNTYTLEANILSSQNIYCWVCLNCIAGARAIDIDWDGSGGGSVPYVSGQVSEWSGIALSLAVDDTATNSGAGTDITGDIITPTQAGDLVLQYVIQEAVIPGTFDGGSYTPAAGITPLSSDLFSGIYSQYVILGDTTPVNLGVTVDPSTSWVTLCIALKGANAGTPIPTSGARIRSRQFASYLSSNKSSFPHQIPCEAGSNIILGMSSWGDTNVDHSVSGITDTDGNTWTRADHTFFASRVDVDIWYAENVVCASGQLALTIAMTNAVQEFTIASYEGKNLKASFSLGNHSTDSGTQSVEENLVAGSITPSEAGGVIIGVLPIDIGAVTGLVSPSVGIFDGWWYDEGAGGFNILEEDNGRCLAYPVDTSALSFEWTINGNTGGAGGWGIVLAHFLEASGGGGGSTADAVTTGRGQAVAATAKGAVSSAVTTGRGTDAPTMVKRVPVAAVTTARGGGSPVCAKRRTCDGVTTCRGDSAPVSSKVRTVAAVTTGRSQSAPSCPKRASATAVATGRGQASPVLQKRGIAAGVASARGETKASTAKRGVAHAVATGRSQPAPVAPKRIGASAMTSGRGDTYAASTQVPAGTFSFRTSGRGSTYAVCVKRAPAAAVSTGIGYSTPSTAKRSAATLRAAARGTTSPICEKRGAAAPRTTASGWTAPATAKRALALAVTTGRGQGAAATSLIHPGFGFRTSGRGSTWATAAKRATAAAGVSARGQTMPVLVKRVAASAVTSGRGQTRIVTSNTSDTRFDIPVVDGFLVEARVASGFLTEVRIEGDWL